MQGMDPCDNLFATPCMLPKALCNPDNPCLHSQVSTNRMLANPLRKHPERKHNTSVGPGFRARGGTPYPIRNPSLSPPLLLCLLRKVEEGMHMQTPRPEAPLTHSLTLSLSLSLSGPRQSFQRPQTLPEVRLVAASEHAGSVEAGGLQASSQVPGQLLGGPGGFLLSL